MFLELKEREKNSYRLPHFIRISLTLTLSQVSFHVQRLSILLMILVVSLLIRL